MPPHPPRAPEGRPKGPLPEPEPLGLACQRRPSEPWPSGRRAGGLQGRKPESPQLLQHRPAHRWSSRGRWAL
eukprot:12348437-Alexandrium_andersonii.AAC.1